MTAFTWNRFRSESCTPKRNAQGNLYGRTHYVDDDTLRYHKARIVSARAIEDGMLFYLIESVALDMNNTRRGFRFAIFDTFGNCLERPCLEHACRTSDQAAKQMWSALADIDSRAVNLKALYDWNRANAREAERIESELNRATIAA